MKRKPPRERIQAPKKTQVVSSSESDHEEYLGEKNQAGQYHGKGVLTVDDMTYRGNFVCGEMEGPGTLDFLDGTKLEGNFIRGSLNGEGTLTCSNGVRMVGQYVDGLLQGAGTEFGPDQKKVFEGNYFEGLRHGPGKMIYPFGWIQGVWELGVLQGKAEYYYPDQSRIVGIWKDGALVEGRFCESGSDVLSEEVYCEDISTKKLISKYPLKRDPYESRLSHARASTIIGAQDGLFASKDIEAGTVVCFYNGIRTSLKKGEKQPWARSSNLMSLNDGTCIDVPPKFSLITQFCGTLGHKANHHFEEHVNSKYDEYIGHPLFGKIKCIVAIRPIQKGEEIFVDYGYKEGTGPVWFKDLVLKRKQAQTDQTDKLD